MQMTATERRNTATMTYKTCLVKRTHLEVEGVRGEREIVDLGGVESIPYKPTGLSSCVEEEEEELVVLCSSPR
tara:strand:- start:29 stop:247 length:219 start_codon:yes stop_codon:yes gene_type:complete